MVQLTMQARDGARLVLESACFRLYGALPFGTEIKLDGKEKEGEVGLTYIGFVETCRSWTNLDDSACESNLHRHTLQASCISNFFGVGHFGEMFLLMLTLFVHRFVMKQHDTST
ncbi:hypothetical protein C4D60_Mb11t16360 [Musa balbisiana]|uniref:Uncharacterized protein n=1 Tax=Musa balbisiana TaxID=52838 RepID=A0A4S8J4L3_MUSBA|nr:hypothetical protein C4D60_Mb11t16360 [Musa balbisiana]